MTNLSDYLPISVYLLTVFAAVASFSNFAYHFYQVNYPRDVAIENKLTLHFGDVTIREKADTTFILYESREVSVGVIGELPKEIQRFKLINFTYFYPLGTNFSEYVPLKNEIIVYQTTHFQSFKPYTFEGFNPQDRQRALSRGYQIKIYKRVQ